MNITELVLGDPDTNEAVVEEILAQKLVLARLGEVYAIIFDIHNKELDDEMKRLKGRDLHKPTSLMGPHSLLEELLSFDAPREVKWLVKQPTALAKLFGDTSFIRFQVEETIAEPLKHTFSYENGIARAQTFSFVGNHLPAQLERSAYVALRTKYPLGFGALGVTSANLTGETVKTTPGGARQLAHQMGIQMIVHREGEPAIGKSYLITDLTTWPPRIARERVPGEGDALIEKIREAATQAPV